MLVVVQVPDPLVQDEVEAGIEDSRIRRPSSSRSATRGSCVSHTNPRTRHDVRYEFSVGGMLVRSRLSLWAVLTLVAVLSGLGAPVQAAELSVDGDPCAREQLSSARVSTSVTLQHDGRTYTKVVTRLAVKVPGEWLLAQDLLLSEDSPQYLKAMSCLARSERGAQRRWSEWRFGNPVVKPKGDGWIEIVDQAYSWVSQYRSFIDVGLWQIRAGAKAWTVRLRVPPALDGAHWDKITVNPGEPGAEQAQPQPNTGLGATSLVWRPEAVWQEAAKTAGREASGPRPTTPPEITVWIKPSWQRSWAAQSGRLIAIGLDSLGGLLWTGVISGLLLTTVVRYRRRPGPRNTVQLKTLSNVRRWAVASLGLFVLASSDGLVEQYLARGQTGPTFEQYLFIEYGFALAAIVFLLGFAGPPKRFWAMLGILAVVPLALVTAPGHFPNLDTGVAVTAAASFCLVALTLLAFAAAAWRIAVDGQLVSMSSRLPGHDRRLLIRVVTPAVVTATVVIGLCFALAEERNWQRATWLSDPLDPAFGNDHRGDFLWEALWSVGYIQDWLLREYAWLLTSLAALAMLRAWHARSALSPLNDRADSLLFLTLFPLVVIPESGIHLANTLAEALWIPLSMLALYGTIMLFARRSVLIQRFEISRLPLASVADSSARSTLLAKARSYREIHAELRRLDQGLVGDPPPRRGVLEQRLNKLHLWYMNSAPEAAPDRLPAKVSVVDAALALGPRDSWWSNGVRGARFALIPGLPAACLATWAWKIRGEAWQDTLTDLFGFPDLLLTLVSWLTTWAGSGFVMGALWRELPGRRGAVKAIAVGVAFAVPVGLDTLVSWFTRESTANVALVVSMMLLVLTVTAIALDLATFSSERHYWQSRLGLLLSVYQMRYYSLQVAYLIGQIIALLTIWQFFVEPDVIPSQDVAPPETP